jgi:PAS domain S-box-containing protein
MKISTRLLLGVFVPLIMALAVSLTLVYTYRSVEVARRNGDIVRQIRSRITELNHLVFSYISHPEDRPKEQFLAEYSSFTQLIAKAQPRNPEQKALLDDIRLSSQSMKELFLKLVANRDSYNTLGSERLFKEIEERLKGQLMVRSYTADSKASLLRSLTDKDKLSAQRQSVILIFIILIVAVVPLTILLVKTRRNIIDALGRINEGTEVIGSGNLDFIIEEKRDDEIGALSKAFNEMTRNLKTVTASKADLEHEIVERSKAEQALKLSEERLQQAFLVGRSFAFEWNSSTDEVLRSQSCAIILGLSGDEIEYDTGQNYFQRVHQDDRERFVELLSTLSPSCSTYHIEYRVVRNDGTIVNLEEIAEGFFNVDGKLQMLVGLTADITERKHAEEALEVVYAQVMNEKNRLRAMMEALPVGVALVDARGENIIANQAFEQIWGPGRPSASTTDDYASYKACWIDTGALVQPDEWASARAVQRGETIVGQLLQIHHFDGSHMFVHNSAAPIRNVNGEIVGSAIAMMDITEQHMAKDNLRKSMARLNIVSDTASQLLITDDPQNVLEEVCHRVMDHLGCDVFFNFLVDDERGCLRLNVYTGISEETASTMHFLDYGVAVCGCAARDACRIVAENIPTTPDIRTDLVRSFGINAYVCHPLFAQEQVIGTLSFGTKSRTIFTEDELSLMKTVADQVATALERKRLLDLEKKRSRELEMRVQERTAELEQAYKKLEKEVAERARIEGQLRHSQKMEAIGTLAGGIAHDFNNILAAIIGFAEMVEEDIPLGKPRVQHVQRVISAATRGRELIQQILAFSRKTGHARYPLSLSAITKETAQLLSASIPATINISLDITATSDTVLATPVEVQQILMNLATNAALSMEEKGGTIQINIKEIYVDADSSALEAEMVPGDYVQLMVSDTGSGMTQEVMERIFEPFFTTREVGRGTGMGLAVVYGIVKSLHGNITVESEPGAGTTISVLLPKAMCTADAGADSLEQIQGGKERILFVDDEEFLVEWGQALLERIGYEVTSLNSSEEALKIFSAEPSRFDLVITDQTMPGATGLQLAKELLRLRPGIPIILCTGHSDFVTQDRLKGSGIREFLLKPLTKKVLAEAIRRALNKDGENEAPPQ